MSYPFKQWWIPKDFLEEVDWKSLVFTGGWERMALRTRKQGTAPEAP